MNITPQGLLELYNGIFSDGTSFYTAANWDIQKKKLPSHLILEDDYEKLEESLFNEGIGLKDYHTYFNQLLLQTIDMYAHLPDMTNIVDEEEQWKIDCIRLVQKYILLGEYTIIEAEPLKLRDEPFPYPQVEFGDEFYNELLAKHRTLGDEYYNEVNEWRNQINEFTSDIDDLPDGLFI